MDDSYNEIDINKLNQIYQESESCDGDVFAEMRSNILLVAGKHYSNVKTGLERNLIKRNVPQKKRLRLVKNHLQRAISDIRDIMTSMSPGVMPYPANENEMSCQKAAELAKSVWDKIKTQNDFEELLAELRSAHTDTGECAAEITFDPLKGGIKGYEPLATEDGHPLVMGPSGPMPQPVDPMTGQLLQADPMTGQPFQLLPDKSKPIMRGQVCIKKIEGYNLLRDKAAKSFRHSKHIIHRDVVDIEEIKAQVKGSDQIAPEDKERILSNLEQSGAQPFKVFDATTGGVQDSECSVEIRKYYFRQSPKYPRGYYFIATDKDILFKGEIPFGEHGEIAFPIKWAPFLTLEASARGFSQIKNIRPAQAEVNRLASAQAETSITLGPDKVLLHQGSKFSRGVEFAGIRQMYYSGEKPVIVPGRDGGQYVQALEQAINDIYILAKVPENANPLAQQFDPKAELFKTQKQKARFTEPSARFARFLKSICATSLFLAQRYISEEDLVDYVGKVERINIAEFKNIDRMDFSIKLEEVSDDINTMLAKSIELETILQYRGKELDNETAGILLSQFPVLNKTQAFKHLTLDLDNVRSDMLAMDRGVDVPINAYDNHTLYIRYLTNRMKQKDFYDLPDQIRALYQRHIQIREKALADAKRQELMENAGQIPTSGAMVKADLYVNTDPSDPTKTERAVFPTSALEWLQQKLQVQGFAQDRLQDIHNLYAINQVNQMVGGPGQLPVQQPMTQGGDNGSRQFIPQY